MNRRQFKTAVTPIEVRVFRCAFQIALLTTLCVLVLPSCSAQKQRGISSNSTSGSLESVKVDTLMDTAIDDINNGKYEEAKKTLLEALGVEGQKDGSQQSVRVATIYNYLGFVALKTKDYGSALSYFSAELQIAETNNDKKRIGVSLYNLAGPMVMLEKYDDAIPVLIRSVRLQSEDTKNLSYLYHAYYLLIVSYKETGQCKLATQNAEHALELLKSPAFTPEERKTQQSIVEEQLAECVEE
jgi:tetratricopeptide (TPR) repeat protein